VGERGAERAPAACSWRAPRPTAPRTGQAAGRRAPARGARPGRLSRVTCRARALPAPRGADLGRRGRPCSALGSSRRPPPPRTRGAAGPLRHAQRTPRRWRARPAGLPRAVRAARGALPGGARGARGGPPRHLASEPAEVRLVRGDGRGVSD
jgi:hypothetical protein